MRTFPFVTLDVFTDRQFGGNPLAVITDARGLSDVEMQALAAEFNYSESTFVLPPDSPAHTAKVRIFNRTHEMPFAGHPNVGTGFVLAQQGGSDLLIFEEMAGIVDVHVERDASGAVIGARIDAPQALSLGPQLPLAAVAMCVGLSEADIVTRTHAPRVASVGVTFALVEVAPDALARAAPAIAAFRKLLAAEPELNGRLSMLLYAHDGAGRLRARMFAPIAGTHEDAATGSANAALAAWLASLEDRDALKLTVLQGVEMGRPSTLHVTGYRAADGYRARGRHVCGSFARRDHVALARADQRCPFFSAQRAPLSFRQRAQDQRADAHAEEIDHQQIHRLAHTPNLTVAAFVQDEAQRGVALVRHLRGFEFAAIEMQAVAQQPEFPVGHSAGDAHFVFLVERGVRADQRFREHAVFRQDQQAARVHVEPAEWRQAARCFRDRRLIPPQVRARQQACGRNLSALRLCGDDTHRLVDHDADLRGAGVGQNQRLPRDDLVTWVGHHRAVNAHKTLRDQRLGLAA